MAAKRTLVSLVLANGALSPSKEALPFVSKLASKGVSVLIGNSMDDFKQYGESRLKQAELLIVIPPGDVKVLPKLWTEAPNIKWIHSWYAGVDNLQPFMQSHLQNTPVLLTNARSAFSSSLAEWVFAVALHFEKKMPAVMHNSKNKIWDKFVMGELRGKTMGFVGFGDIAKTAARIAKHAFGMRCIAMRRDLSKADEQQLLQEVFAQDGEERLEVFKRAHYVVCSLPGTSDTFKTVGLKEFTAMRPDGVFISIGRGTVVDEDALADVLEQGKIGGAALDVFHKEPLSSDSRLWNQKNVLITAHNADWVETYGENALNVLEKNLELYMKGEREQSGMYSPVDATQGY